MSGISQTKIEAEEDQHVFIRVVQPNLPVISLDITARHGRRALSVRVDGMGVAGVLVDVEALPPHSRAIQRFCPYCGEEQNLFSSGVHVCDEGDLG